MIGDDIRVLNPFSKEKKKLKLQINKLQRERTENRENSSFPESGHSPTLNELILSARKMHTGIESKTVSELAPSVVTF